MPQKQPKKQKELREAEGLFALCSSLSLGQTAGGTEQGLAAPRWEMFSCVASPEATNINCPGNKLQGDTSTDTAMLVKTRELGLGGLPDSSSDESHLWQGSEKAWPYKKATGMQPGWVIDQKDCNCFDVDHEDVIDPLGGKPIALCSFLLSFFSISDLL